MKYTIIVLALVLAIPARGQSNCLKVASIEGNVINVENSCHQVSMQSAIVPEKVTPIPDGTLGLDWKSEHIQKPKPQPRWSTVSFDVVYPGHPRAERMTFDVPHRTADPAWYVWNSAAVSLTAADLGLAFTHLGYEANPLVKDHPIIVTGIAVAGTAAAVYFSHRFKREDDAARANGIRTAGPRWWMMDAPAVVAHGVGLLASVIALARHR